jgi:hypothetical protein
VCLKRQMLALSRCGFIAQHGTCRTSHGLRLFAAELCGESAAPECWQLGGEETFLAGVATAIFKLASGGLFCAATVC